MTIECSMTSICLRKRGTNELARSRRVSEYKWCYTLVTTAHGRIRWLSWLAGPTITPARTAALIYLVQLDCWNIDRIRWHVW